jgi:hypothetical protein
LRLHDIDGAKGMNDQRWKELCRLIMSEQDPNKMSELVSQLNQEFERREMELRAQKARSMAQESAVANESDEVPEEPT